MAERGIGVRALARQVPCDHALVSRLLSGRQPPSADMARRLDEILAAGGRLAGCAGPGPWRGRGDMPPLSAPVLVRAISRVTLGDLGKTDGARHAGPPSDRTEADRIEWLPLAEVPALIDQGAIVSGPTLIALLYLLTTRDRPGLSMTRD